MVEETSEGVAQVETSEPGLVFDGLFVSQYDSCFADLETGEIVLKQRLRSLIVVKAGSIPAISPKSFARCGSYILSTCAGRGALLVSNKYVANIYAGLYWLVCDPR